MIDISIVLIIFEIVTGLVAFCTLMALMIKPIRERIFNMERSREGERCLLRSEMLRIYYNNLETKTIREYERENFIKCYEAYKALNGNSFIEEVNEKVRTWTIVR